MLIKKQENNATLVKVKQNYQITLPGNLRKKFNIGEGDYMEIENQGDGIIIKPVKVVHPDHEYFYTKEWQKGEAQADKDIANEDMLGSFNTADECVKALKKS